MRKLLVIAASIFLLSAGAAFAQDDDTALDVAPNGDTWVGASTGYPFGLNAHYGIGDGLGDGIDLRFNGSVIFIGGFGFSTFGLNLGADALFNIPIDAEDVSVYAGAGPNIGFISSGGFNGFNFGAQGLAGAEYSVSDELGIFGEFRLGLAFGTIANIGFGVAPGLGVGVNYHF